MKKLRLGLLGATGRMGTQLSQLVKSHPIFSKQFELVWAVGELSDPEYKNFLKSKAQVVVDFSAIPASLQFSKDYGKKTKVLVCTTGFNEAEQKELQKNYKSTAWILAANTSLGVFLLTHALKSIQKALPKEWNVEIVDIHHVHKKDAPSGTAKHLAKALKNPPTIKSIRQGEVVGEHKVIFSGDKEKLEFTHMAEDRSLFAIGALQLAQKLSKLKAKSKAYSVEEVF